jgi:hypothetical protein
LNPRFDGGRLGISARNTRPRGETQNKKTKKGSIPYHSSNVSIHEKGFRRKAKNFEQKSAIRAFIPVRKPIPRTIEIQGKTFLLQGLGVFAGNLWGNLLSVRLL